MGNYNFNEDYRDGKTAELESIERLKKYYSISSDTDFEQCNDSRYDIKIISSGLTYEVKNDLMAEKTGNIAIEYECRGKQSGLAITIADFWIYKFCGDFFLFDTKKLRAELFINKNYYRDVIGGDAGSNTKMFLVKISEFKKWGIPI
jgi:hypothetical protein